MLIMIEFARNNYREALKSFAPDFLQNAYFLFLETDIDTCVCRVRNCAVHAIKTNDHFVSEEIIRTYYAYDDIPQIVVNLKRDYGIEEQRVKVINNTQGSLKFFKEVNEFAVNILSRKRCKDTEQLPTIPTHTLQTTGPIH
jgi:gluconate kinase